MNFRSLFDGVCVCDRDKRACVRACVSVCVCVVYACCMCTHVCVESHAHCSQRVQLSLELYPERDSELKSTLKNAAGVVVTTVFLLLSPTGINLRFTPSTPVRCCRPVCTYASSWLQSPLNNTLLGFPLCTRPSQPRMYPVRSYTRANTMGRQKCNMAVAAWAVHI